MNVKYWSVIDIIIGWLLGAAHHWDLSWWFFVVKDDIMMIKIPTKQFPTIFKIQEFQNNPQAPLGQIMKEWEVHPRLTN